MEDKFSSHVLLFQRAFGFEGICDVEVLRSHTLCAVILTEREDNHGPSVTNTVELIASMVYRKLIFPYPPERVRWIEHYPERSPDRREILPETWDLVTFGEYDTNAREFRRPSWAPIRPDDEWFNRILDMRGRDG